MTPVEKVQEAERQLVAVISGQSEEVSCPFCGLTSRSPQPLCCDHLAFMADSIMNRQQVGLQLEIAHEAMDRMARSSRN